MNTVFGRLYELRNLWKTLCVEFRIDLASPPSKLLEKILARAEEMGTSSSAVRGVSAQFQTNPNGGADTAVWWE